MRASEQSPLPGLRPSRVLPNELRNDLTSSIFSTNRRMADQGRAAHVSNAEDDIDWGRGRALLKIRRL